LRRRHFCDPSRIHKGRNWKLGSRRCGQFPFSGFQFPTLLSTAYCLPIFAHQRRQSRFQRAFQGAEGLLHPAIALPGRLERGVGLAAQEHPDQALHPPLQAQIIEDWRLMIVN
jgi:hypothetical protein